MEKVKYFFLKWLAIGFVIGYGVYVTVGYARLYFFDWSTTLVEYIIHPDDIGKEWQLLPFVDKVSLIILEQKNPMVIQQDFSHIGLTLGSVAVGFRDHSRELTADQRQKAKELTILLYSKGIVTGIKFVDNGGCTALQGAIINKDFEVAKILLDVGGKAATVSNPSAYLKLCRKDAYTLAMEREFQLPK